MRSEIETTRSSIFVDNEGERVILMVANCAYVEMTVDQADALIRALGAARVEVSTARPKSCGS
jgi:hypothetical protein